MKEIIIQCLDLICEMCGAEYVRMKVIFEEGSSQLVVMDQTRSVGQLIRGRAPDKNLQIPFFPIGVSVGERVEPRAGGGVSGDAGELSYVRPAAQGIIDHEEYWEFVAEQPSGAGSSITDFTPIDSRDVGWEVLKRDGGGKWRFKGMVNGFQVEMYIVFVGERVGHIHRRLSVAGSILKIIESLIPAYSVTRLESEPLCLDDKPFDPPLVGRSAAIVELRKQIRMVSDCGIPILIEGESGTGKEIVARNVHYLSKRCTKPLVIVNCMELPESLFQSELFGHTKGSFTGASRDRIGLIESAGGGTLFLDEIGEIPLSLQAALLRVLQEKEVRRIGESIRRRIDVQFVFATNKSILELVRDGKFREDLYFRINGIRICIPPLRQRREDILILAGYFLRSNAGRTDFRPPGISPGAARRLLSHQWPGNVRELKNEMERVMALNRNKRVVTSSMLSQYVTEDPSGRGRRPDETGDSLPAAVRRLERQMIKSALERFQGNRTRTSRALGITRQGLLKKLKRYGITEGKDGGRSPG